MYIFKGGHRTDRHSPSWNAVCRKESSKRRQRPSAQHWGSPPTTSSQPLGVFRPGGEERGEDEGGQDQGAGSQEGRLGGAALKFWSPAFPLTHPLGAPGGGERRRQFARTEPGCAPKSPLYSPEKLPPSCGLICSGPAMPLTKALTNRGLHLTSRLPRPSHGTPGGRGRRDQTSTRPRGKGCSS